MSEGKGKLHADINSLSHAKQGIDSEKITERKVNQHLWCAPIGTVCLAGYRGGERGYSYHSQAITHPFSSNVQKSCSALLDLLERGHVLDYIEQHSRNEAGKGGRGGPSRSQIGVTWTSLFRSVVGFITKETEAIQKLEEKGNASSAIAQSNRVTKKKVPYSSNYSQQIHFLSVCVYIIVPHLLTCIYF